jgi:acyl carrier protein
MNNAQMEHAVISFAKKLCERSRIETEIDRDTDLFASGVLDSLRFVALFAHLQAELGVDVPDKMLGADFFRTPAIIADNFAHLAEP